MFLYETGRLSQATVSPKCFQVSIGSSEKSNQIGSSKSTLFCGVFLSFILI